MSAEPEAEEMKTLLKTAFVPETVEQPATSIGERQPARSVSRYKDWLLRHLKFVLTVVVPTMLASIYFGLIASDVYVSESRFVVRTPDKSSQSTILGQLIQGSGMTRSQDDTAAVHDYIQSRDAMRELDQRLGIRKMYMRHGIDIFARFPRLDFDDSLEAFYKYYKDHITVDYDPDSSISVLTVRAYNAADANKINALLLEMSEQLVNRMSERSRNDLIHFADNEVKIAAAQARDASLALLAFRTGQSVFEPGKQAEIELESVAKVQEELVSTEAELAQVKQLSPSNPQIIGLESRAETLRSAIRNEAAKVTHGKSSLSTHAAMFERLTLESEFADKELGIALETLEASRNEAARKQLYLDRLVEPNLQDKAMEPKRIRSVFTVFAVGVILWGVVSLVVAAIREHAD